MAVKKNVVVSVNCEEKEIRSFGSRDERFENDRDEIVLGFLNQS